MSLELLDELEEDGKAGKDGPSLVVFLVVCIVVTLFAGGAGFGVSATMLKPPAMAETPAAVAHGAEEPVEADAHAAHDGGHGAADEHAAAPKTAKPGGLPSNLAILDLAPITTSLLDPEETWIRMELSLAFEGESDQAVAEEIHQDILAYVHTMKLYNLRGGSGFQHLMEDLDERAAIRSEGRVKRVLVRSFILE